MAFTSSTAPDITEALPFAFSARGKARAIGLTGFNYDYFVGGIGFNSDPSQEAEYRRASTPVTKQQFDASREPGEQTLEAGYWIRSQMSWHRGAGIRFYEPGTDDDTAYRFAESSGVDVWEKGQLTLLKDVDKPLDATSVCHVTTAVLATGEDVLMVNLDGVIRRWDGTTASTYTMTSATTAATAVAVAGSKILWGSQEGICWANLAGSSSSVLHTQTVGTVPVPYWVKSRIIASKDADLFELTLTADNLDTATPLWTHPAPGWTWTSVAESPTAVLAAGYGGGMGAIYRFSLQDGTGTQTPKLSPAYQVAEFPPGEEVHSIRTYLGRFVGIGTSRGVRIGVLDADGNLTYGPLLTTTSKPVRSLAARDTFMYAAVEDGSPSGGSGCIRVNLAEQIGDGLQFAWAWDAEVGGTGRINSVALFGVTDRVGFAVESDGIYVQSDERFVESGSVTSGRIRYGTVEPKVFRVADMNAVIPSGSLRLSYISPADNEVFLASLTPESGVQQAIGLGDPLPSEFVSLKLVLSAAGDGLTGPTVKSIQVKAVPAPHRTRRIQLPLHVTDFDRDPRNAVAGHDGWGWERLVALEELEDNQAVVTVADSITGESFLGVIEQTNFTRTGQVAGNAGGFGKRPMLGRCEVIFRQL